MATDMWGEVDSSSQKDTVGFDTLPFDTLPQYRSQTERRHKVEDYPSGFSKLRHCKYSSILLGH